LWIWGFLIVSYTHHMVNFCLSSEIRAMEQPYCDSFQLGHFTHLSIAFRIPQLRYFRMWRFPNGGFLYTLHGRFYHPTAIACDDIWLYHPYWNKPITFLSSLDTSLIYFNSYLWSHNWNISENGGFLIVSYTHQQQYVMVSASVITIHLTPFIIP
jgi:hypothetical protein